MKNAIETWHTEKFGHIPSRDSWGSREWRRYEEREKKRVERRRMKAYEPEEYEFFFLRWFDIILTIITIILVVLGLKYGGAITRWVIFAYFVYEWFIKEDSKT